MPEIGAHQLEVAETLIGVGRFLIIFVAARLLAELLVRLQLPTILGELVAGVLIGGALWWLFVSFAVSRFKARIGEKTLDRVNRWTGLLIAAFGFALLMEALF